MKEMGFKKGAILIETLLVISLSSFYIIYLLDFLSTQKNIIVDIKKDNNLYSYFLFVSDKIHKKKIKKIEKKRIIDYIKIKNFTDIEKERMGDIYFNYKLTRIKTLYFNEIPIFVYNEKFTIGNKSINIHRYIINKNNIEIVDKK
jgi:hypothetical protein